MASLSKRILTETIRSTFKEFGIRPLFMDLEGRTDPASDPFSSLPRVRRQRTYALQESINLGQPHFYELTPGFGAWLVALENRRIIHGALIAGEAFIKEQITPTVPPPDLDAIGLAPGAAWDAVRTRLTLSAARLRDAALHVEQTFYMISGWKPLQMTENRLRVQQQQQIAEAIEDRKKRGGGAAYPFEMERVLLSHIRAGDRTGARRVLNDMLGAMYTTSPKLVVLRARAIEMMGYLTRAAVEDSPAMESLIARNHEWMDRLIRARDFEDLARVLTDALNDFIENIYLHGFNRSNVHVGKALDFITHNATKPLRLKDIAGAVGLSTYRLAHLVKAHTGKTIVQIVTHARVQHARALLEQTEKPCADIAYESGFNDQSYFIKHFKRITGITPARYRRTRMVPPREEA